MEKLHKVQVTELLNRLQTHNWQEFAALQEQANTPLNPPENLILDEDPEDEEVLTNLFDPELEDYWNKTHD